MEFDKETKMLLISRSELGSILRGPQRGDIADIDFEIDDSVGLPQDIDIHDLISNENTVSGFMKTYLGLDPRTDSLSMRNSDTIEFDQIGIRGLLYVVGGHLDWDYHKTTYNVGTPMDAKTKKEIERTYDWLLAIYDEQVEHGAWPKIND